MLVAKFHGFSFGAGQNAEVAPLCAIRCTVSEIVLQNFDNKTLKLTLPFLTNCAGIYLFTLLGGVALLLFFAHLFPAGHTAPSAVVGQS